MIIRTLSTLECTRLLTMHRVAHLACAKDGQPYVVPINYAYADSHLYAFSMLGKKIEWMRINPLVSLQVHEPGDRREWRSVVVDGRYEELPEGSGYEASRHHAWSLLSKHFDWWEPGGLKPDAPPVSGHSSHVFYRILVEHVSGREAKE
ncbi:MAG: pyridoxamine 5'-phosphate oxidase family protein [Mesorhizobium sp.]|uniref:pyridoxamine 5'-phosphate oxidase family protein n=1 Tax=Mesorhizobium sp. TaxID=1871066 RepID=UPI000FE76017|nr:pyridoxamine 5'-phosphate oxidase family protein [Mesorhizobium sp.]RWB51029.1 MAG: pyridoxamine 5'-phosphate oxidase family protein [Mesorhizobium sp.]TIU26240.1 MAG: pyridoxamine 5'-phosphate oxidase family protein [Mesorhizobium sp.]